MVAAAASDAGLGAACAFSACRAADAGLLVALDCASPSFSVAEAGLPAKRSPEVSRAAFEGFLLAKFESWACSCSSDGV